MNDSLRHKGFMKNDKAETVKAANKGKYLLLLLVLAGVLAYCNSLAGPFIFDDEDSIPGNTYIRQFWPADYLFKAPPDSTVAGRPVVSLSLALNYAFCGYNVRGYHAVNLAIHILAGLLLYGIVRRTLLSERLKKRFGRDASVLAWAVATIWLVHPLQTESVTYIIQRTESLMGLFYLLTLYCAMRAFDSTRKVSWSVLSVICCCLGMATKESMVTAPVIVLFYDRCFVGGSFSSAIRRRWGLYTALAGAWIILIALMWSGPRAGSTGLSLGIGPLDYAANQSAVIIHYLRLSFWPARLCLDYSRPASTNWGNFLPSIAVIAAVIAVIVWGLIRNAGWSFAGAWFFGILAPTSSFVPVADLVFEHRMYLPLAALTVLLILCGYVLLEITAGRFAMAGIVHRFGVFVVIVIAAVLTGRTLARNRDYRSAESIWQSTVKTVPLNPNARLNLGKALHQAGKVEDAIAQYQRALLIKPEFAAAHSNLGVALKRTGKIDEAISHYNLALQIRPDFAEAHNNLANILLMQGRLDEAISHYRQALLFGPDSADVHNNLGLALAGEGKADEAIIHFEEALRIRPDFVNAKNNLASALNQRGQTNSKSQPLDRTTHEPQGREKKD